MTNNSDFDLFVSSGIFVSLFGLFVNSGLFLAILLMVWISVNLILLQKLCIKKRTLSVIIYFAFNSIEKKFFMSAKELVKCKWRLCWCEEYTEVKYMAMAKIGNIDDARTRLRKNRILLYLETGFFTLVLCLISLKQISKSPT